MPLRAATLYWAPGNSPTAASGTWDTTTANWATNTSGTGTLQPFTTGDAVNFANTGTTTVDGAVNPLSITSGGTRTLNGVNSAEITISSGTITISGGATLSASVPLAGLNGIDRSAGSGTLNLNVANPNLSGNSRTSGFLNLNVAGTLPAAGSLDLAAANTRVNLVNSGTFTLAGITANVPGSPDTNLGNRRFVATAGTTGSATLILDRAGSDELDFYGRFGNGTNSNGVNLTKKGSFTQVLLGSLATENANATTLRVEAGTLVFQKDAGKYAWSATHAGSKIEVAGGELRWDAGDQIAASMDFTLSGGTLDLNGFRNTNGAGSLLQFGELTLGGAASIDFGGTSASELWFADSSSVSWGASNSLSLLNFQAGTSLLRFGTSSSALTGAQLAMFDVGAGNTASLDADGFVVVAVPEPAAVALAMVGGPMLALLLGRRRKA